MVRSPVKSDADQVLDGQRQQNRRGLAKYCVWKRGPQSRAQLAEALNLNLPTVSVLASGLLSSGELVEEGFSDSTGGRKAQLVDLNGDLGTVVGLTFSSRGITSATADLKGRLHNHRIFPFSPADGRQRALDTVREAIGEQVAFVDGAKSMPAPSQIGIGISGVVNRSAGVSRLFPRFEEWRDVPLREIAEKDFGVPAVVDSHLAAIALAEATFGKHRGFRNALYVQLGPGLGVGIIIGGRVYRGSQEHAGEFGHTAVVENGPVCYCGSYGCLESVASDSALVQQAEAGMREGVQTRIGEFLSEPGKVTPGAVLRAAAAGDRFAANLTGRVASLIGMGIANLVNLFGPELVILGGTMAEAGELMINPISATMAGRVLDPIGKGVEIRSSSFGNEEGIKGAVTLALEAVMTRGLSARDLAAEAF